MSNKKAVDPRVVRSKRWLQESLLYLMLKKPFSQITISEITDHAGLSRPTFYLHYKSKEDLLYDYLDGIYGDFYAEIQDKIGLIPGGAVAVKMFEQIQENAVFLKSLLDSEVSDLVLKRLHDYVHMVIKDFLNLGLLRLRRDVPPNLINYVIASMAGSSYAILVQWLRDDMPNPPKEMGKLLMRLSRPGILEVITENPNEALKAFWADENDF